MQYYCDDILRILALPLEAEYDHDAFAAHVESCSICRKLGILEPGAEKILGSLLSSPAPETIGINIMTSIRQEAKTPNPIAIAGKVRFALLGAIYVFIALITLVNQKAVLGGIITSWDELNRIWSFSSSLGITRESLVVYLNRASLSPILLTAVMGIAIIFWTFSVLRFRETN
jgi:hypothetical protein